MFIGKRDIYFAHDATHNLILDLDGLNLQRVHKIAGQLSPEFGSYLILETSKGNHAIIFDRQVKQSQIKEVLNRYSPAQSYFYKMKGRLSIRLGYKNSKKPPYIKYTSSGTFNYGVIEYLLARKCVLEFLNYCDTKDKFKTCTLCEVQLDRNDLLTTHHADICFDCYTTEKGFNEQ